MLQQSKLIIEDFGNGITCRYEDESSRLEPLKCVAVRGEEPKHIGEYVWESIFDTLAKCEKGKVEVNIEIKSV